MCFCNTVTLTLLSGCREMGGVKKDLELKLDLHFISAVPASPPLSWFWEEPSVQTGGLRVDTNPPTTQRPQILPRHRTATDDPSSPYRTPSPPQRPAHSRPLSCVEGRVGWWSPAVAAENLFIPLEKATECGSAGSRSDGSDGSDGSTETFPSQSSVIVTMLSLSKWSCFKHVWNSTSTYCVHVFLLQKRIVSSCVFKAI